MYIYNFSYRWQSEGSRFDSESINPNPATVEKSPKSPTKRDGSSTFFGQSSNVLTNSIAADDG
jgi:hypothetical protein